MHIARRTSFIKHMVVGTALLAAALMLEACQSQPKQSPPPKAAAKAIRINAGTTRPFTDPDGNIWLAETGFAGGDTVDRGNVPIANTKMPQIYRTEHYSMTAFSYAVPNGKYTVKLHFAETFSGVTAKGERVFSLLVEGTEIKDLDVFAEAAGAQKALVKTVPVTVQDGKLDIVFKPGVQNPEINGIEIIPAN